MLGRQTTFLPSPAPVMFVGLLVSIALFSVDIAVAANSPSAKPKDASGQTEQTPEQAAGGFANLMRMKKACEPEAKRFCPDVKPGGGRILQCLHQHESDLSPGCQEAIGPRPANP